MFAEITTALASIKVAGELATLVLNTKVSQSVTQKAIELQTAIISLQTAIMSIQAQNQETLAENNSLKQKLIDIENWEAETKKYSLKEVAPGAFVYVINQDQAGAEPSPWLCTNCYNQKKRSILQRGIDSGEGYFHNCPSCKAQLIV